MGGRVEPVKIGLVGYGFGGRYLHAPLLASAPECELLLEQDSDLDRVFTERGSRPVSLVNGAWDTFYPTFARAVRGEGPPRVEATDAVPTADVLESARVSVERRATVRPGADR